MSRTELETKVGDEMHARWQQSARASGRTERFKPVKLDGAPAKPGSRGLRADLERLKVPDGRKGHYRSAVYDKNGGLVAEARLTPEGTVYRNGNGKAISQSTYNRLSNKFPKGRVLEEDILNIPNRYLAENNRMENLLGARAALDAADGIVIKALREGGDIPGAIRKAADEVHTQWLKRNTWAAGDPKYKGAWKDLSTEMKIADVDPLDDALSALAPKLGAMDQQRLADGLRTVRQELGQAVAPAGSSGEELARQKLLRRLSSPKANREFADVLHRTWQQNTPYRSRYKPVLGADGKPVKDLDAYLESVPEQYHNFYNVDGAGNVVEDIKRIPNRFLARNNQASNLDGAKDYLDITAKFLRSNIDDAGQAAKFLEDSMQEVHSAWLARNSSWAKPPEYPAAWRDLSPDLQITNLQPFRNILDQHLPSTLKEAKVLDEALARIEGRVNTMKSAVDASISQARRQNLARFQESDPVDAYVQLLDENRSLFTKGLDPDTRSFFSSRLEVPGTARVPQPRANSPEELGRFYDEVFRQEFAGRHFPGKDVSLIPPSTPPGSGAVVYLVKDNASGSVVGAYKVQARGGLEEVLSSMAGERILKQRNPNLRVAENLQGGKFAGRDEYFLVQRAAPGRDLDGVLSKVKDPVEKRAALRSAADAMSDFHNGTRKGAQTKATLQEVRDNGFYEVGKFETRVIGGAKPSPGSIQDLLARGEITKTQARRMRSEMTRVKKEYERILRNNPEDLRPTLVHGDAHGGNIFLDEKGNATFIDYGTVLWSTTTRNGAGVGDRGNDVGRMLGHLVVENIRHGARGDEALAPARRFLEQYKRSSGIKPGTPEEKAFHASVDFNYHQYLGLQSSDIKGVKFNCPKSIPDCDIKDLRRRLFDTWREERLVTSAAPPKPVLGRVQTKAELAKLDDAIDPPRHSFVKDAPVLGYRITSDRFEDIPEAIRKHLGAVDQTKYTPDYLRKNIGSVMALQVNKGKPDFYIIGKSTFDTSYVPASLADVEAKNPKYFSALQPHIQGLNPGANPNLVPVLKTNPVDMVRMSDMGYPVNREVKIETPWGDTQTKPKGSDAYLVWDKDNGSFYMVNTDSSGLPLSYVPKSGKRSLASAPSHGPPAPAERATGANEAGKKKYDPLEVPSVVDSGKVAEQTAMDINILGKMGVGTYPTHGETFLAMNVNLLKKTKLETAAGALPDYGRILEVNKLPPPGRSRGPNTNAFLHPEMASYAKKLEDMGYRLVVDTSLPFTGAGAYVHSVEKVLALGPDSNWQIFLHEFQHAEFFHYLGAEFPRLKAGARQGRTVAEILPAPVAQAIGAGRVQRLQALLDKGLPELAINETLSVDAELRALGFRRFIPGRGSATERYALRHQITELSEIAERGGTLSEPQTLALEQAKRRHDWLLNYEVAGEYGKAFGIGVGAGGAGLGAAYGGYKLYEAISESDPGSYRQVIYDNNGNVLGQKSNGSWVNLQRRQ